MNTQELDNQIEEGQSVVARAEELMAAQRSLNEEAGISGDIFAEVLASDNFSGEFKDKIRDARAKAISEIEARSKNYTQGGSNKIASHQGVTKI